MDQATQSPPPNNHRSGCYPWAAITIITCVAMFSFVVLKSCGSIKDFASILASIPAKFGSTQITQTFRERLTSLKPTHGDILEVAVAERDETISRADMKTTLFNIVYLGTTVSEIRVPAVYRYHVRLSDEWKVGRRDTTCVVIAPVIHASDPPAIRSDKMESKTKAGWLRFNAAANLAALQKNITPILSQRSANPAHIDEVREGSRKAVAEFVKNWLISEDQWKEKGFTEIVIVFADEPAAKSMEDAQTQKPAVNLLP